jgi:hypothetical protein
MAYVDFMLSLIWQRISDQSYECIFLNAIAIFSIKDDGTYLSATDTTPIYAAILAVYRGLVLYKANFSPHLDSTDNEFQQNVISLTQELLTYPSVGSASGPISWILSSFAYANTLSKAEMKVGEMFWDNETLNYGVVRVSVMNLQHMILQTTFKQKDYSTQCIVVMELMRV